MKAGLHFPDISDLPATDFLILMTLNSESSFKSHLNRMSWGFDFSSVDNFDLAMAMNGNGQENGDGYIDHTFHTPSFGDEEFDIPPINLPPTTPGSDTNSSDVYGSTQPLSHQEQPTQQQQQQSANNNQQHLMSPPPQMSPSPCSQTSSMERIGPVMTAITTTPSPPTMMTSFSGSPQHHHQQQHHQASHVQQQQQQLSQHQQHQYGNHHPNDMYAADSSGKYDAATVSAVSCTTVCDSY
ncbi:hypothetical protein AVEN_172239-1 [Araneus ventricosus]|uniref:Uncharacterized protein n=1 Tax=Araneus ventricosus TaxID=182803 RepID=A0A4Y2G0Z9_ARAVE|nr:hypothetical protein AVEN_172239-1 [Araneus ventricosus]